jgi:hypothetical protein
MMMLSLLTFAALAAPAVAAPSPAVHFVGHAAKICLYSRANPAAVKKLAEAEGWTAVDPASAPGESPQYILGGKVYTRTHAWRLQKGAATYWVALFDVPGQPKLRECSFMAWDMDFDAVDAVFTGSARAPDDAARKVPARMYQDPRGTIMYSWTGYGEKRLHVVSVTPKP